MLSIFIEYKGARFLLGSVFKTLKQLFQITSSCFCRNSSSLDVNYLHVARAAQFCSAHFSVLLYIELWAKTQLETIRAAKPYEPFATDVTELDIIYQEQDEHTKKTLHSMLKSVIFSLK